MLFKFFQWISTVLRAHFRAKAIYNWKWETENDIKQEFVMFEM